VKIRLIMMLKNEGDLALSWITYHGSIVGYEKLIILDNGSTCDRTLSALKQGMAAGATVDYQYAAKADFTRRDQIYAALVQRMDSEDPADFYIALDCDEFLSVVRNGRVDCSSDALEEELSSYVNCPNPLVIHSRLDNDPHRPGFFRWSPNQRKVFFAKDGCESLDQALHIERSRVGPDPIRTKLVCITYRNKPYDLSIEHLKASLAPSGADFRSESVRDYVDEKEDAGHCPARVPGSEKEYARGFNDQAFIEFPEIGKKFEWFGENLPFSSNGAKT
jgi:hypothetical protein